MEESYITPKELPEQTELAETDELMVTDTNAASKRFLISRLWTWIWNKIKGSTRNTIDTTDTAPVNSSAVNKALTPYLPTETGTNPTTKYNDDLNNILTEGRYSISGSRWANYPDTTQTLMLSVFDSKNWVGQIAISANYTFTRRYSKDTRTWSAWQKIINDELLNEAFTNFNYKSYNTSQAGGYKLIAKLDNITTTSNRIFYFMGETHGIKRDDSGSGVNGFSAPLSLGVSGRGNKVNVFGYLGYFDNTEVGDIEFYKQDNGNLYIYFRGIANMYNVLALYSPLKNVLVDNSDTVTPTGTLITKLSEEIQNGTVITNTSIKKKVTSFIDSAFNSSDIAYTEDNGIVHIWGKLRNTTQKTAYANICYVPRPQNDNVISTFLYNTSGSTQKLQIITDQNNKGRLQNQIAIPANSVIVFDYAYASYNAIASTQSLDE